MPYFPPPPFSGAESDERNSSADPAAQSDALHRATAHNMLPLKGKYGPILPFKGKIGPGPMGPWPRGRGPKMDIIIILLQQQDFDQNLF